MCEGFDKIFQWDEAEKVPKLHLKVSEEDESETVLHAQKGVRFYTDQGELGRGVMQVTSMRLLWFQPDAVPLSGYEIDWTHVTLHAVSRDPESGYPPCIYCQISPSDEEIVCECRFVPDDPSSLGSIFDAMSKASEMNPDPANDEELDDDNAFVASGDFDFPISYEGECEGEEEDDDDKTKESNGGFKRKI